MNAANKFVGPSVLLFLDQSLVAITNWFYWLIISKLSTTSELGQATTISSLVLLIGTITQLGLEYPLLKRASTQNSQVFGTILTLELVLTFASVPVAIYAINNFFHESLHVYTCIAVAILIPTSLGFVSRFTLLGIPDAKSILLIDVISTGVKFIVGYTLVTMGFGALGILLSFLFQTLLITGTTLAVLLRRMFSFRFGSAKYFKEILKEGLTNLPSKLSRMLILSISVVLLASFGLSNSEVGIFYIALMISIFAGTSASSIAYMIIPASSASKRDLSTDGMRIGLSFVSPLIAALIVAPKFVLSIIGTEYISGYLVLLVLSIAILPSSIVINTISKFNTLNKSRKLISIGVIEILTFFLAFFFLVPNYGSLGAALSTLVAFIASSIPSIVWSEHPLIRYVSISMIAIVLGVAAGYIIGLVFVGTSQLVDAIISAGITMIVIIRLKNTSTTEIRQLVRAAISGR
jgi:O-antigen/teichoic acid export membrane protein